MLDILNKAYQHETVCEKQRSQQATDLANIFYHIDQIKQQANVFLKKGDSKQHAELTQIVTALEQTLIAYSVLPYSEKIAQKHLLEDCCMPLQPHWNTAITKLIDTIYQFLNRIIRTLNQKCGFSFSLFKINP